VNTLAYDDSDVKIFGSGKATSDTGDLVELASLLDRHRRNGNIAKAKQLGNRLATLAPEHASGIDLSVLTGNVQVIPSVLYQIRVLLVFAAQTTVHKKLPLAILSSSAVNAMYDSLIENAQGFYDNISDGAAFTFYYLSLRKGNNVALEIGERFAMLCGMEGNETYAQMGARIYTLAVGLIEEIIDEFEFADV